MSVRGRGSCSWSLLRVNSAITRFDKIQNCHTTQISQYSNPSWNFYFRARKCYLDLEFCHFFQISFQNFHNFQVNPFFHRHIIGSGVVLFVFHRYADVGLAKVFVKSFNLTDDPDCDTPDCIVPEDVISLYFETLFTTIAICAGIYIVMYQTRVTRLIAGITAGPNSAWWWKEIPDN